MGSDPFASMLGCNAILIQFTRKCDLEHLVTEAHTLQIFRLYHVVKNLLLRKDLLCALANLNNDESPTSFVNTVNIGAGSLFTENSANMGGAIYNMGTMSVSGVFDDNDADTRGGAIHNMGNMTVTRRRSGMSELLK